MNDIFIISGIGIVSAAIIIILKQYKPEFAFAAALSSGILILLLSLSYFTEIFDFIKKLISVSGIKAEKFEILFKCFGICVVTKIASETCRDCGLESISSKIDFSGKTIILISSLPLFSEIIEVIEKLIFL